MGGFAQWNKEVELKDDEHKVGWKKRNLFAYFLFNLITTRIYWVWDAGDWTGRGVCKVTADNGDKYWEGYCHLSLKQTSC